MSKICIITDQHFGARMDMPAILDNQEKFYKEVFFPTIDKHKIKIVIDGGDTFDKRKNIDYQTFSRTKEFYFEELKKRGITVWSIVGNHSVYYKDKNDVNSLELILKEYEDFHVVWKEPHEIVIDGKKILLAPWITESNYDRSMEVIKDSRASILVAHLELEGFQMQRGTFCKHGMSRQLFRHFDRVWTGHFHSPSIQDNIHYLGSPTETTWADHGDDKGFYIYETKTDELEFIENPYSLHQTIDYNDEDYDYGDVEGKIIMVNVYSMEKPKIYAKFKERLFNAKPADVKFSEKYITSAKPISKNGQDIEVSGSTIQFIENYVKRSDSQVKDEILKVLLKAYSEATGEEE